MSSGQETAGDAVEKPAECKEDTAPASSPGEPTEPEPTEAPPASPRENSELEDPSEDDMASFDIELPPPPAPIPMQASKLKLLSGKIFKQGYLSKSSTAAANQSKTLLGRNMDVWKKRWLVLQLEELSYYKTEDDFKNKKSKLGAVALTWGYDAVSEGDSTFAVTSRAPNGRTLRLKAANPELKSEWLTALDYLRQMIVDASQSDAVAERLERLEASQSFRKPTDDPKAVELFKQGYLCKQGGTAIRGKFGGLGKTWKKRWVVLNSNGLSYYESEEECKGGRPELTFIGPDRTFEFKTDEKLDTAFSLVTTMRTLPFRADTKEIREEWLGAMRNYHAAAKARSHSAEAKESNDLPKATEQHPDDKLVDKTCIREGYLTKQAEKRGQNKDRYFVLFPGELRYYKHPKDLKPIGTIALDSKSVLQPSKEEAFTLFLVPVPNGRQYVLATQDLQQQIDWLEAFRRSVPEMRIQPLHGQSAKDVQIAKRSSRSIKEGFMLKQGRVNKDFKRRYFVLEPTALTYYKGQHDKEPKGSIVLAEGDSITAETDVRFVYTSGPKQSKTVLICESPVDLLAWLNAFQATKKPTVNSKLIATPLKSSSSTNLLQALH